MRVGLIMPLANQRGGAELMLMHLLKANKTYGKIDYQVVFLEDGPLAQYAQALGYPVQVFEAGRVRDLHKYIALVFKLRRWIKEQEIDLVMSWMSKAHLYIGPAALLSGTPAIWWQHGKSGGSLMQKLIHVIPAKAVICCSAAVEREQSVMTPKLTTKAIYPAIDAEVMNKTITISVDEARDQLGLPKDKIIVGIAARMQRWKGVHVFVEAAKLIHEQNKNTHFVLIGGEHFSEKEYHTEIKQLITTSGLSACTTFGGHQSNPALWMRAFDIVVHASIGFEPFGMVVIEGMALEKGVIATKTGGPEEIISDGINGLLIEPNDPSALASAIGRLIEKPSFLQELGSKAKLRAGDFRSERLAEDTADFICSEYNGRVVRRPSHKAKAHG
ncbi:glycosyltransferase family 4 protein [Paenibacillus sp. 1P07SE]|uniref:glycosyltransferase family 4 protein n=1 Tax=Paenibacillus sp. 1P07SE TaxID=3132209 RepID=UPI0039A414DB